MNARLWDDNGLLAHTARRANVDIADAIVAATNHPTITKLERVRAGKKLTNTNSDDIEHVITAAAATADLAALETLRHDRRIRVQNSARDALRHILGDKQRAHRAATYFETLDDNNKLRWLRDVVSAGAEPARALTDTIINWTTTIDLDDYQTDTTTHIGNLLADLWLHTSPPVNRAVTGTPPEPAHWHRRTTVALARHLCTSERYRAALTATDNNEPNRSLRQLPETLVDADTPLTRNELDCWMAVANTAHHLLPLDLVDDDGFEHLEHTLRTNNNLRTSTRQVLSTELVAAGHHTFLQPVSSATSWVWAAHLAATRTNPDTEHTAELVHETLRRSTDTDQFRIPLSLLVTPVLPATLRQQLWAHANPQTVHDATFWWCRQPNKHTTRELVDELIVEAVKRHNYKMLNRLVDSNEPHHTDNTPPTIRNRIADIIYTTPGLVADSTKHPNTYNQYPEIRDRISDDLCAAFGTDTRCWELAETLADTFPGTVAEFTRSVHTLATTR